MERNSNDLTSGSVAHTLLRFFWPLLLAHILQSLYVIVDMLVVGRYVGSVGLAAVSNASMLMFVVTSLSIGIGTGGTVRIAYYTGAGLQKNIRSTVTSMMALSVVMSLVVSAVLLIWLDSLLALIRVPDEAMGDAYRYMRIITTGNLFVFGFNAAGSLLRGQGNSRQPMHFIVMATSINLLLDLFLVGFMGMGVSGAAYATIVAQAIACLISFRHLYRGLGKGVAASYLTEVIPILKIGMPTAIQLIAVNISFTVVTAIINTYGVNVAAATGIGLKLNTFAAMPCWTFGHTITAMTGQCIGGRKAERAKETLLWGLGLNLLFSSAIVLSINIAAEQILDIFDPGNSDVVRIGVRYLRVCCSVNCIVYCVMYTFDAFAIGAGDATVAMFNSLLDSFVIRLSLGWLLGMYFGYGYEGIFLAQALAPIIPAIIGVIYYATGKWRRRLEGENPA